MKKVKATYILERYTKNSVRFKEIGSTNINRILYVSKHVAQNATAVEVEYTFKEKSDEKDKFTLPETQS